MSCAQVTPATVARVDYDLTATTPSPATVAGEDPPQPFGERGGAFFPAVASACDAAAESAGPGGYPVSQDPPGPDGIDEPAAAGDGCGCGAGPPPAVAADPVSLMLAQAEANRCRGDVREGRLTFGPAAVPKDAVPPPVAAPDVDEEGLYALDKAVVELKTCKRHGQAGTALASDTDALLALEEDAQLADEAAAAGPAVPLPSYADVGYGPETPSCAPLVAGVSVPAAVNPRPTVVYDATACAAPPPPTTYAAEYSPRYCTGCGGGGGKMTSSRYQCSCDECCSCGKSAGGVYSCRKSSY